MDSSPETPYELLVKRNIEANKQMLRSLGLLDTPFSRKNEPKKPRKQSRPRQIKQEPVEEFKPRLPVRRTRYSLSLLDSSNNESVGFPGFDNEENTPPNKRRKVVREHVFGEVEGVSVGDWWLTRLECSAAGVHRPTVAGISGRVGEGCYSIALSGGYEDDLDCGECFTYTGSGGRDLKGTRANPKNLRTAPQSRDQTLDGMNAALALNIETKKPVRVIRGYKLDSPYAPEEGYRYDGLYSVEKHWYAAGASGFKVCKFALKRLADQNSPPWDDCPMALSSEKTERLPVPTEESAVPSIHEASLPSTVKIEVVCPHEENDTSGEHVPGDINEGVQNYHYKIGNDIKQHQDQSPHQSCTTPVSNRQRSSLKLSLKEENMNISNISAKSSEKKVRFSSNVHFTDEEGRNSIEYHACDSETDTKQLDNIFSDVNLCDKKQSLILKYFSPVKKPIVNQTYKCTVNPKSLRSNRFSCFPQVTVLTPKNEGRVVSPDKSESADTIDISTKSPNSRNRRSMSVYRKVVESVSEADLIGKGKSSMMENLIKQNKDKLRLHSQHSIKRKTTSKAISVKPCYVLLFRLEDTFLGWDIKDSAFSGFSEEDETAAHHKLGVFQKVCTNIRVSQSSFKWRNPNAEEDFHGWE